MIILIKEMQKNSGSEQNVMWWQKERLKWCTSKMEEGTQVEEYRWPLKPENLRKYIPSSEPPECIRYANTWIPAQWHWVWTSDLRNCQTINLHSFKQLSSWSFVAAAVEMDTVSFPWGKDKIPLNSLHLLYSLASTCSLMSTHLTCSLVLSVPAPLFFLQSTIFAMPWLSQGLFLCCYFCLECFFLYYFSS